jgi:polyketide cyclase/dehydrase/lipid transport protein
MQALDYDSGSIDIDAPPQVVFTLITDIHQMARFSPELVSCRWLDGADRAALGARFEAVNQVPGHRPWKNRPVVTVYEPHQRFAISRTELFAGTLVWAYDLDSDGNKTVLTESYQVTKPVSRIGWMIIEKGFGGHGQGVLRRGIHDTLDAIKAAAESTRKPVVEHRNMRSR